MPADTARPWLPWSPNGEIRYRDGTMVVDADVYPVRATAGGGWKWSATVASYVAAGPDRDGSREAVKPVWSGVCGATDEAGAKRQAERWISAEIRKLSA